MSIQYVFLLVCMFSLCVYIIPCLCPSYVYIPLYIYVFLYLYYFFYVSICLNRSLYVPFCVFCLLMYTTIYMFVYVICFLMCVFPYTYHYIYVYVFLFRFYSACVSPLYMSFSLYVPFFLCMYPFSIYIPF